MSHWDEQIRRYGVLQQYFTRRHEQAHKTNLKDIWNASNQNLNYLPQVITLQHRILCFKFTGLNLQSLPQRWENSTATCKVFALYADLAAPQSSQSYAMPEVTGPQNHRNGKYPTAMITDLRALLGNMQDETHHIGIYCGTRKFMKPTSRNLTYTPDEVLHLIELFTSTSIKVQVQVLDFECISQMCQCTGSQSCRRWDRQNDWIWVKNSWGGDMACWMGVFHGNCINYSKWSSKMRMELLWSTG